MFYCNQCETEYGGIRGVTAECCPRCAARNRERELEADPLRSLFGPSKEANCRPAGVEPDALHPVSAR